MGVTQSSSSIGCCGLRGEVEPLAGSARLRPATTSELAVRNRTAFADGLARLGLGAADRNEALRVRDEVAGEVRLLDDHYAAIARASYRISSPPEAIAIAQQRRSAFQRLSDWFADRQFEVHATTTLEVRVPLFVVAAPDVDGCRTTLAPAGRRPCALSAEVVVYGAGGGAGAIGHVTTTSGVSVAHGERTVVFVPVTVTVADVTVYDAGRQIGRGIQVGAGAAPRAITPGALRYRPGARPAATGALTDTYFLRTEAPGSVQTYERVEQHPHVETRDLRLGLAAFGVDATIGATVSLTAPVVLDLDLAGGHDYELHEPEQGYGLAWRTR